MRRVIKLRQHRLKPKRLKVAAYARVSKESERSSHSLAAQVSYYSGYIQSNPEWEYRGVYIDSFIGGTQTTGRNGFNELMAECDAGNVDLILVKSISRFARNTVDLLNTVRHLKEIGVAVFFEKERLNTLSTEGEFLLTVLASFAQEEINSMSNNIKWAFRRKFRQGIPHREYKIFGYEWKGGTLAINETEAGIVRRIYTDFLTGNSVAELARVLNEELPELDLNYHRICRILENEVYTGKLIMQKTYSINPVTKKNKVNKGELPFYVVDEHHEPIIETATFEEVRSERQRRMELGAVWNKYINTSSLTGKIKCGCCGSNYIKNGRDIWMCRKRTHGHGSECSGRNVPDEIIKAKFTEICGQDYDMISAIIVNNNNFEFRFNDGNTTLVDWKLTGNKDRWTDEERQRKRDYTKAHPIDNGRLNCFTSKIQCGVCGENFRRQKVKSTNSYSWSCAKGKKVCGICWMREEELKRVLTEALELPDFDETDFTERVKRLVVHSNEELTIYFKDGAEKRVPWDSKRRIRKNAESSTNNTADD